MSLDDENPPDVSQQWAQHSNAFNELKVEKLVTQWKHKISVIPESAGIRDKWWTYSSGVSRTGPQAEVPAGEHIYTNQTGEYIVGSPALAGTGWAIGSTLPQSGTSDDVWCGYTNRLNPNVTTSDGAGVGVKYFTDGQGDEGGADGAGVQPYVWFDSAITGRSNLVVPADQWNGVDNWENDFSLDYFRDGCFVRFPYTYYNEGSVGIVVGDKPDDDNGFDPTLIHEFGGFSGNMWSQSDLSIQASAEGTNPTAYVDAAHYKAGKDGAVIQKHGQGRDGAVRGGAVSLSQGSWYPLITFKLKNNWENVNIKPTAYAVKCDNDFYLQITRDSDLDSNASFSDPPNSSIAAVQVDNTATGFANSVIGQQEHFEFVSSDKKTSESEGTLTDISVPPGVNVTLMIMPIDTSTTLLGSSLEWGGNF